MADLKEKPLPTPAKPETRLTRVIRLLEEWGVGWNPLHGHGLGTLGQDYADNALLDALAIALTNTIMRDGQMQTRQDLRRKHEQERGGRRVLDAAPEDPKLAGVLVLLADAGLPVGDGEAGAGIDRDNFLERLDVVLTALLSRRGRKDWPARFTRDEWPGRVPPQIGEETAEDLGI